MYLVANIFLNIIDVLILFLLSHSFVKRIPIFTVKRVLIGISYGIVMGAIAYLLDDGYIYRIIAMPTAFVMIWLMIKLPFSSTFLVYTLVLLFVGVIQLPVVFIAQLAQLGTVSIFLIIQILSLAVILLGCKILPFNRWYRFIEEHIELKLLILIITFIAVSIIFYWNFEYTWLYVLHFGGILIATLIAIYTVGSKIVHLRYKIPLKTHNDYHVDLGLMVKAYREENHPDIENLNRANKNDKFKLQTENFQLGRLAENIITFIDNKQKLYDQQVEILHDIDYDNDHPSVNVPTIIKMLSILLDNAIETGTNKPIIVELTVTMSYMQLSVRNEFTPTDSEEISRIFTIDGYTTKKTNQRGYGLTNLYYDVKNIGGKIMAMCDHSSVGKSQYLNITITI